jgi:fluoroacetyl-CoA thioesterase
VAVLESICLREMQNYIDAKQEMVIGSWIECRQRAPIPIGALIRITGWVTCYGDQQTTFWVQASDEQEVVCEGQIRISVEQRSVIEKRLRHKRKAIRRRELFAAA